MGGHEASWVGVGKIKAAANHREVIPHHRHDHHGHSDLDFQMPGEHQATFNVLYVQTPRIGVLQAPFFRAFADTCVEAAEMVKPLLRFGIRETSIFDKCPYYDPEFHKSASGHLMAPHRTREVLGFMQDGSLYNELPHSKHPPKGHFYIHDFPNPLTVLLLNLGAYYLLTRQGNRMRSA